MRNPFTKPTPEQTRQKQLEDARLDLLNAEMNRECWEAECAKLKKRIDRLSNAEKRIIE